MYALDNYDTTDAKEPQPFENPPPQGYVLQVVEIGTDPSTNGRPMVTLKLDIAEGAHAGAFQKYPKPYRQVVDKDSMPYFKVMIGYFAASNPPAKMSEVIFTNRDGSKGFNPKALLGLRVGGNLGEAEYMDKKTGEIKVGMEVRFLGAAADAQKMRVLPLKKLDRNTGRPATKPAAAGQAPAADDSDLPF